MKQCKLECFFYYGQSLKLLWIELTETKTPAKNGGARVARGLLAFRVAILGCCDADHVLLVGCLV